MNDYRKYFDNIIDRFYEEIKPIITDIRKIGNCNCCGGTYINSSCKYCQSINVDLERNIKKLEILINRLLDNLNNLPFESIPINKLFNLLYSIRNNEISCIENILTKYNYSELYNLFIEQTLSKIKHYDLNLTGLEINALETLIYRNENDQDLDLIYRLFVRNAVEKKQNVNYECFKLLIKQLTEMSMKLYYPKPLCLIKKEKDLNKENKDQNSSTRGTSFFMEIGLLEEDIRGLYENGDPYIIFVICHELTHTKQYKELFSKDGHFLNAYAIKELKDFVLKECLEDYYEENYDYISYENEANYVGFQLYAKYLESCGIFLKQEYYDEKLKTFADKMKNNKRYINGRESNLDDIFDEFIISSTDILDKYPQFKEIYKLENGFVVLKEDHNLESFNNRK